MTVQTIVDAGASTSATDNSSSINSAFSSNGEAYVPKGSFKVTSIPTGPNALGEEYTGPGDVLLTNGNGTGFDRQINLGTDLYQRVTGQEYLYPLMNKLKNHTENVIAVFSGDSTTENWGLGADKIENVFKCVAAAQGHFFTTYNRGVGGASTAEYNRTVAPASGREACNWYGDLRLNPDVLVLRFGVNDVAQGRTISQFAADLRAVLGKLRNGANTDESGTPFQAGRTIDQMAIVLMAPNAVAETGNARNETWNKKCSKLVKKIAREYQCCFIDTFGYFADARGSNTGGTPSDTDRWLDGERLHPQGQFNRQIVSVIADVILPVGIRPVVGTDAVTESNAPADFPIGWSLFASSTFPITAGQCLVYRGYNGECIQKVFNATEVIERTGTVASGWRYWHTRPATTLGAVFSNGWSGLGGDLNPAVQICQGRVHLSGFIANGTTRANGSIIMTLPAALRPKRSVVAAIAAQEVSGGIGTVFLEILSSGLVRFWSGGTVGTGWIGLDNINFEGGN